jgi:hypothetical protein
MTAFAIEGVADDNDRQALDRAVNIQGNQAVVFDDEDMR